MSTQREPLGSVPVCECGHRVGEHEVIDHDKDDDAARFRRENGLARWHLMCTHDPVGDDWEPPHDSPWDHICGCFTGIWEPEPGVRMVGPEISEAMRFVIRTAFNQENQHADA